MDRVISLLVFSTLPQLVVPQALPVTSFSAVVEMVSGDSRIFSGESARLKCKIPNIRNTTWGYLWFKGSEKLPHFGEYFPLWKAHIKESGKYYCQGVRDTVVGKIHTLQSLPVEITVDGGWAIMQVPPHPSLVGHTLGVTCRVRGRPPLHEVILYKDGVEVTRQRGPNPHFSLTNLTTEDQGMYSCRASWDAHRRTYSVISANAPVQVLEVLSQPVLEIDAKSNHTLANMMKLICHLEYNAPAPAPPIHFYFYKDNNRLGTSTSENHDLVRQTPGQYSCKAKVPELNLIRWSEPISFGEVTGQQMMPSVRRPKDVWPLARPVSTPVFVLPRAVEPAAAQPTPQRSTPTPTFIQPTEVSTQSFDLSPTPSTLPHTIQTLNQTAIPETVYIPEESGDMSGDSGDISGESGDMPQDSPDTVLW